MQCERAAALVGAYLDQELDADTRREVADHMGRCPACAALADDLRRTSRQLAALGRQPAPERLAAEIRRRLGESAGEAPAAPSLAPGARPRLRGWLPYAAALLVACGLTAAGTALLLAPATGNGALAREVAAAHVRSLLQESPVQIASSEVHTVKPWFAGRLEFAPSVRDLAGEGFPLVGARLDYVAERRVAALVYRRRLHTVNVFLWPAPEAGDSAPRQTVHHGYNILAWRRGGITYWAVSDLNMGELRQLQGLLG